MKAAARPPAQASAARTAEQEEPVPQPQDNGKAIGLANIEAVKDLVERVGATSLKNKLIDVLAR
jgi:hypothetical protein